MEEKKRVSAYQCLECKRLVPISSNSINYCSAFCRMRHKTKIKTSARTWKKEYARLNPKPSGGKQRRKSWKKHRIHKLVAEVDKLRSELAKEKEKKEIILKPIRPKHEFYDSDLWRNLRYQAIKMYGRKCKACGTTSKPIHIDHIKPRSKYPELQWDIRNLQPLCEDCNLGKSNTDETDWRNV